MSAGRHSFAAASVMLVALLVSRSSSADPPTDSARAQALFDDALKLMEAKHFATACPKLAESFELDPAGGTALDLGFCFEHAGQLASALHAYQKALEVADADHRADRSLAAKNKIDELNKTAGHIHLVVPPTSWRSEKWSAFVDGQPLRLDDLTAQTAVDAGPHVVTIIAPDKRPYEHPLTVNDGTTTDIVVDGLIDARAPTVIAPSPHEARPVRSAFALRDDVPRRNWGIAIGGVGIVGLGVGTVGAIAAASLHAQSNDQCPASGCVGNGIDSEKQADRMAWVANIGFAAGVAMIGLGTYLFFSARHSQRVPTMSSLVNGKFAFDLP